MKRTESYHDVREEVEAARGRAASRRKPGTARAGFPPGFPRPDSPRSGRRHLAHGEPAVGRNGVEGIPSPAKGDIGSWFERGPRRHPRDVSVTGCRPDGAGESRVPSRSHGWLAVGHTMSPLRGLRKFRFHASDFCDGLLTQDTRCFRKTFTFGKYCEKRGL